MYHELYITMQTPGVIISWRELSQNPMGSTLVQKIAQWSYVYQWMGQSMSGLQWVFILSGWWLCCWTVWTHKAITQYKDKMYFPTFIIIMMNALFSELVWKSLSGIRFTNLPILCFSFSRNIQNYCICSTYIYHESFILMRDYYIWVWVWVAL